METISLLQFSKTETPAQSRNVNNNKTFNDGCAQQSQSTRHVILPSACLSQSQKLTTTALAISLWVRLNELLLLTVGQLTGTLFQRRRSFIPNSSPPCVFQYNRDGGGRFPSHSCDSSRIKACRVVIKRLFYRMSRTIFLLIYVHQRDYPHTVWSLCRPFVLVGFFLNAFHCWD